MINIESFRLRLIIGPLIVSYVAGFPQVASGASALQLLTLLQRHTGDAATCRRATQDTECCSIACSAQCTLADQHNSPRCCSVSRALEATLQSCSPRGIRTTARFTRSERNCAQRPRQRQHQACPATSSSSS